MTDENYETDLTGPQVDTSHLAKQDRHNLDLNKLTPLTPEVISRQATINIGSFSRSFLSPFL